MKNIFKTIRTLPGWSSSVAAYVAWIFLFIIAFLAIFGPLIANEKPYFCKLEGKSYYPIFTQVSESGLSAAHPDHAPVTWRNTSFETVWRAPVPFSHQTIDLMADAYLSPLGNQSGEKRFRHWLGTDVLGRDVLAGMIRGCRVSLLIGLGSMLLALMIGIPVGSAAAYWGNKGWRITTKRFLLTGFTAALIFLIWYTPLSNAIKTMITLILISGLYFLGRKVHPNSRTNISIPLDQITLGVISIIDGFPGIFLILILVAIIPIKGWVVVMFTIALLRWPSMARYMRAEVFKMRETNYIKAAQIANIPAGQILRKHIIPYAFRPVMISFIFGVSSAILTESSLSFLGIGLPSEEINWGRLLAQSRNNFDAWWLVVFPGCAIFFTLLSLYTIGNAWQKIQLKLREKAAV
jgi:peptide/nickel transport system permease protein